MTINQLFIALCGFYTTTRVAVYSRENDIHFFYDEEDHAEIIGGIINLQTAGYGTKVVDKFYVRRIHDNGTHLDYVSILLAKEDTSC